jgi:hypothetical protein
MSAPRSGSTDSEGAEAAARTVLRLLAVGDIEIVWLMLHVDYCAAIIDDFLATPWGPELLAAYNPRLHRAQFLNLTRQQLLAALNPLPWAEADRRARAVDVLVADDCVVVTFEVDGEPDRRWDIEMTLTDAGWQLRNLARR